MQCSKADKIQIVPLIDLIVRASEKARKQGLLALEDDVNAYENPSLILGMQLVVDGTDPRLIESILTARIFSTNKRGKELLEQIIVCDGVLSIQAGDNPRLTEVKLFSFLGDEADELYEQYVSEIREHKESAAIDAFQEADGEVVDCFADTGKLLQFDDRAIQKVLREVDMSELVAIVHGAESDVRKKIVRNMSRGAADQMASETQAVPKPDTVKAQVKKLQEIIAKLKTAGEISVPE